MAIGARAFGSTLGKGRLKKKPLSDGDPSRTGGSRTWQLPTVTVSMGGSCHSFGFPNHSSGYNPHSALAATISIHWLRPAKPPFA